MMREVLPNLAVYGKAWTTTAVFSNIRDLVLLRCELRAVPSCVPPERSAGMSLFLRAVKKVTRNMLAVPMCQPLVLVRQES